MINIIIIFNNYIIYINKSLIFIIFNELDTNNLAFLVYLDQTKAFDTFGHKFLLKKPQRLFYFL